MPKSEKQKLKLLYLKEIFERKTDEEHKLTLAEIIELLKGIGIKAERKSLYDDIRILQGFGMDIVSVREKQFRYYLASREFELPELKLLVDVVQSSRFITYKKSSELIKKLESLTSNYNAAELHRTVYLANRTKAENEKIYYNIDYIYNAISKNSKIEFKYFDWNLDKELIFRKNGNKYTVSPWALIWDDENYYLVAYSADNQMIRHYRVDRMTNIEICDEIRDGKEEFTQFDIVSYIKKVFGMFRGHEEILTLKCKKHFINVIIDKFGTDVTVFPQDDDYFKVNVNVMVSPLFFAWLFEFGDGIVIESPDNVIDEYKQILNNVINHYLT